MKPFKIDGVTVIGGNRSKKKLVVILPSGMNGLKYEAWQAANKAEALSRLTEEPKTEEPVFCLHG